ncbi:hypothetical protein [Candidatus Methylacidithermus pantelleriae]|uniref:Uncharacterized protein n=1 Tax=Candidatus Methylacidithermus pantelleriae TaxID=2744239 RepID=A0A8J2BLJ7_9BACT|nr:hypothetical protein [Candidatus Methylacidithermus pantelleriae]CAF0705068.1 hypothetical protein MPNT_80094 [Candidatus Methylacidithermus pantelleriae]
MERLQVGKALDDGALGVREEAGQRGLEEMLGGVRSVQKRRFIKPIVFGADFFPLRSVRCAEPGESKR